MCRLYRFLSFVNTKNSGRFEIEASVCVCVCGLGVSNGVAEGQVAPLLGRLCQDRKISLIWTDKVKKPLRIEAMKISTEDGDWDMP